MTFLVLIYLVFFAVQFTLDNLLDSDKKCNNTWFKIFKGQIDAEVVILGNSRAEAHYNSEIITNKTNLKCYNLGVSGTPLNVLKIRWKSYVNRNKRPKVLILDVDYNVLGHADGFFEKFQYLPYVNKPEYIEVAKEIGDYNLFESYLPLYKYVGYNNEIFNAIELFTEKKCSNFKDGFIIRNEIWNKNEWYNFKKNRMNEIANKKQFKTLYENGIKELEAILEFCRANKIKVYLIWSPQYIEVHKFKENQRHYVDSMIKKTANTYKLDYFNFSNDSLVFNKSNFYNHSHLNKSGADIFSKKIAHLINIKQNSN